MEKQATNVILELSVKNKSEHNTGKMNKHGDQHNTKNIMEKYCDQHKTGNMEKSSVWRNIGNMEKQGDQHDTQNSMGKPVY